MYAFPNRKLPPHASTLDLLAFARATAEPRTREPGAPGQRPRRARSRTGAGLVGLVAGLLVAVKVAG